MIFDVGWKKQTTKTAANDSRRKLGERIRESEIWTVEGREDEATDKGVQVNLLLLLVY